jgi:hypothetical protein
MSPHPETPPTVELQFPLAWSSRFEHLHSRASFQALVLEPGSRLINLGFLRACFSQDINHFPATDHSSF